MIVIIFFAIIFFSGMLFVETMVKMRIEDFEKNSGVTFKGGKEE